MPLSNAVDVLMHVRHCSIEGWTKYDLW
jgi:hypothetical protein